MEQRLPTACVAKRLENTLLKTAEHRTAPVEDPFVVLLPSKTPPRHEMHVQFMALRLAPPSVTGGSFLHLSESPCIRSSRPPSLDFGDRGAPPHEQQMPHHRHETTHWPRVAVAVLSPQLFPCGDFWVGVNLGSLEEWAAGAR